MERRLTEEQVTKAILTWLEDSGWFIVCYDFPQSGTGISLHPEDEHRSTKNKGAIIPDVIAVKDCIAIIFENKSRFVFSDLIKINQLITGSEYQSSLKKILDKFNVGKTFYGIGMPNLQTSVQKIKLNCHLIDFAVVVNSNLSITVFHDSPSVFN